MSITVEELSSQWRKEGKRYASQINEYVRQGMACNWEEEIKEPADDNRSKLAGKVLKEIKAANENGQFDDLRELFPPATWPFNEAFQEAMQGIEPIGVLQNQIAIVQKTNKNNPEIYTVTADSLECIPGLYAAGLSQDRRYVAVADQYGIRIIEDANRLLEGTQTATFSWGAIKTNIHKLMPNVQTVADEENPSTSLIKIIPFAQGTRVLVVSHAGSFIASTESELIWLLPDPAQYEEDEDEEEGIFLGDAMGHAAISPDEQWVAFGSQCSDHMMLNLKSMQVYETYPVSSYPHYCSFSVDGKAVWFNSCHFYNGDTIKVTLEEVVSGKRQDEEWPLMDEGMRVYAAAVTTAGQILGDAYGYLRYIDHSGEELWRFHIGSTISGLAVSEDEQLLVAGTYGGMLHFIDLQSGEMDQYAIGTAAIKETARWLIWKEEQPLRW